jgi:hypothetical protein
MLLGEQPDEVHEELVGLAENRLERVALRAGIDLRVTEESLELRRLLDRRGEVAELLPDLREPLLLSGRFEQRLSVDAVSDGQRSP